MMTTARDRLTEPLGTVTALLGGGLLAGLAAFAVLTLAGLGSIGGFGRGATVCATQPRTWYSGGGWADHLGVAARPGASISVNGTLQACAAHPGIGQRILYTLTNLPGTLAWACVLFLLWRLIVAARRTGPFTVPAAAAMRRLGWVIIGGSVAAAAVQGFALDQLLNTMLTARNDFGDAIPAFQHLLVPVLAGAALLTFARIIRLGADMDDEIKGTV